MNKRYYKVILNQAKAGADAEILVHGPIGKSFWSDDGISGKEFTDALNEVKGKVTVGVNSQGGEIGEGLAIFNAIKRRAADVTARIDGYALSIASFFPLAANKVVSPESSIWMIHKAWNFTQGNADQLRKDAEMLDVHDTTLLAEYIRKTGKSNDEMTKAMSAETWLTGKEAIQWGLADEIGDNEAMLEPLNFAIFKNVPAAVSAHAFAAFVNSRNAAITPANAGQRNNKNNSNEQKRNTCPAENAWRASMR